MRRPTYSDYIYIILLGISIFLVICYGSLLTNTILLISLMLWAASGRPSFDGKFFWPIHIAIAGLFTLITLHGLYNPTKKVFTNADHHILSFIGYETSKDTLCLIGDNSNQPIWNSKDLGGTVDVICHEQQLVLEYETSQPIYQKLTEISDSLVNREQLPTIEGSFTLTFTGDSLAINVAITDVLNPTNFIKNKISPHKKDSCVIEVEFLKNGKSLAKTTGSFHQFIRRSLTLYDIISDIPFPKEFELEPFTLQGVTLLRDIAGAKSEDTHLGHFHMAFSPIALSAIKTVKTNGEIIDIQSHQWKGKMSVDKDVAIKIGAGLYSTPYLHPQIKGGKLYAKVDKPLRQRLPIVRDSLDVVQTAIISSSFEDLASSPTSLALHYPVFTQLDNEQQFYLAVDFLPEETLVPLKCKLVPLSNDKVIKNQLADNELISAGDSFTLVNEKRQASPVFQFENLRETVPFSSTKGYLLVIAVLLGALISLSFGGNGIETRGETLVWLFLMALLSFRSFLAWRASVFPPLDGFSETSFSAYNQDTYKYTLVCSILGISVLTVLLFLCKIAKRLQWDYKILLDWTTREGKYTLFVVILLLLGAFLLNERLRCVFIPVFSFFYIELWYYQNNKIRIEREDFKRKFIRYLVMMTCVGWALLFDAGFGIVFTLFLLLYHSLKCYLNWRENGYGNLKRLWPTFVLVLLFTVFMFGGIYIVPIIYSYFNVISIITILLFVWSVYHYYRKWTSIGISIGWRIAPLGLIGLIIVGFVFIGQSYLNSHRHLLYRSEVHIKPVDEILMDEKVNTRDMERLFQASQNRWYLDYYTQNNEDSYEHPYRLRQHFNKGITWYTQKTDAVLGRYVIGEHSIWTAFALLLLFIIFLTGIFSSSMDCKEVFPIKYGGPLLLLCQAVFITLAVTNRFIFFGQDYPLISLGSALTVIVTFTLLFFTACGTLSEISYDDDYHYDKKPAYILSTILIAIFLFGRVLKEDPNKAFNVGNALNKAKRELAQINHLLMEFQNAKRDSLISSGLLSEQKKIQTDYSAFINRFDQEYIISDSIISKSKRTNTGISPFTASMYLLYRGQLSKNNNATDIIHLRKLSDGHLEFGINNKYYRLTTPESDLESWQGNILPEKGASEFSLLSFYGNNGASQLSVSNVSARIDNRSELTYNYPFYLAKINTNWIPNGSEYYIIGKESQEVNIKQGAKQYRLLDASKASHYFAARSGDYIETITKEDNPKYYSIFIKGEKDKYFARNMLVNGRRMMIYPMSEKTFYPYHLAQLANAVLSGKDKSMRMRDITVTLSYPLTESLFDDLNIFNDSVTTRARSVIVADGDGHIKAMATVKNPAIPSGYIYVNPNDYDYVAKLQDKYYLTGDVVNEARAFGDLNLAYLQPGPGSSIKPITYIAVVSQAYADWRTYSLYVNCEEQSLPNDVKGNYITTNRYAGRYLPFESLYSDEIGESGITDVKRYIQKSSNYYNSLMVYLGYYSGKYISQEFDKAYKNKHSELFSLYNRSDTLSNFPAFRIGNKYYSFRHWLTDDGMPRHENGALQIGFEKNFGLWKDEPASLFDKDIHTSIDIFDDPCFDDSLRYKYAFAYPAISYLPEKERITRQGTHDAIRNTTLGASPFQVTPFKMAEMYGKLFSQNRKYKLSLNPSFNQDYEPFILDKHYKKDSLYESILSNYLFEGMAAVTKHGGTAGDNNKGEKLSKFTTELEGQGYYVYAKTGTIGNAIQTSNNQLLAIVITKGALNGKNKQTFNQLTRNHKFYVIYFVTENSYHDYSVIRKALNTIVNSNAFTNYMNRKEGKK